MKVKLKFDYSAKIIFIPDGYVSSLDVLHSSFFDWLYDNPEYMGYDKKGNMVCSYDASAFLEYINQEVLSSSQEKAYFLSDAEEKKGSVHTLEF